jgi:hypothetical protein
MTIAVLIVVVLLALFLVTALSPTAVGPFLGFVRSTPVGPAAVVMLLR